MLVPPPVNGLSYGLTGGSAGCPAASGDDGPAGCGAGPGTVPSSAPASSTDRAGPSLGVVGSGPGLGSGSASPPIDGSRAVKGGARGSEAVSSSGCGGLAEISSSTRRTSAGWVVASGGWLLSAPPGTSGPSWGEALWCSRLGAASGRPPAGACAAVGGPSACSRCGPALLG